MDQKDKAAKAGRTPPRQFTEEVRAAVRAMCPIDDLFFNKMAEDPAVCEEIISTILQTRVQVRSVIPQDTITSLQGRSVRLDALADALPALRASVVLLEDSPLGPKGAFINIEVQKSDDDDHQRRARFNASAITMNATPSGTKKFRDIPDVVELFISAFDLFHKGKNRYVIDRVIRGEGTVVHNGLTEIYVNTAVRDTSTQPLRKLTDLMALFSDSDTYDFEQFPNFSARKHLFKETEEGEYNMSDLLEQLIGKRVHTALQAAEQEKQAALQATASKNIKSIMENLGMSLEKAMDVLSIPLNERATYANLVKGS